MACLSWAAASLLALPAGGGRVVVELRLDGPVAASRPDVVAGLGERRERIAEQQSAFLELLGPSSDDSVTLFETVPFLALDLDRTELRALLASARDAEGSLLLGDVADPLRVRLRRETVLVPSAAPAALDPWAETLEQAGRRIGAPGSGFGGSGQTLVFVDSGVDLDSPLVQREKVIGGEGFVDGRSEGVRTAEAGEPLSSAGIAHGTLMASIACGPAGVAPGATVISLRVGSADGRATDTDVVKALESVYLVWRHEVASIAAVCLAFNQAPTPFGDPAPGFETRRSCEDVNGLMTQVIRNLDRVGIPVVVPAGNDGFDDALTYPACVGPAFAVAASERSDGEYVVRRSSNWGGLVDVVAPGGRTYLSADVSTRGTSVSAACAAGAIALLRAAHPSRPHREILLALTETGSWRERGAHRRREIDVRDALAWLAAR